MIIGIDLGTTNSCAAYMKDGRPEVICLSGKKTNTLASAVSINGNSTTLGFRAREKALREPESTVTSAKRLIGRSYHEVSSLLKDFPYEVKQDGATGEAVISIGGIYHTIPEISSKILAEIRMQAEAQTGKKVTGAVITVPAYFTDVQREATRKAGKLAGLDVPLIISEPTAAALAYGQTGRIAVFDLGGGTFDISVLSIDGKEAKVLATGGDLLLGGDDIDRAILCAAEQKFIRSTGRRLRDEKGRSIGKDETVIIQRLRNMSEKAKITLSENPGTDTFTEEMDELNGDMPYTFALSRAELNTAVRPVCDRAMRICAKTLQDAGITKDMIDRVVLVGGSTKSPYVRERVEKWFGMKPDTSLNPDEAVALGATLAVERKKLKSFRDVTPLALAIEVNTPHGTSCREIIPRHTEIPVSRHLVLKVPSGHGTMRISVVQMQERMKTRIGELVITGLSEGNDDPTVDLDFSITESGIISLDAKDAVSGVSRHISLQKTF